LRIAAGRQPVTPHQGYSPELVEHLRSLGFDVPHSGCPKALETLGRADRASSGEASGDPEVPPFDPSDLADGRRRVVASIFQRRGQGAFRDQLLRAYGYRCAVSGCDVPEVLEAAHIVPFRGEATNHVQNGLLLRADLYTLFDLGLLDVDAEWCIRVETSLKHTAYWEYEGKRIALPEDEGRRPSRDAFDARRRMATTDGV
jgi:putative restriction endonuclease